MISDPFGLPFNGLVPDFPGATTVAQGSAWARGGIEECYTAGGIAPVASEHWARIHSCAEDFRSELSSAGSASGRPPATHLRLASPTETLVSELEEAVRRDLRTLEWVCTVPHTDLTFREEVLAVDRARRPAGGAIPYLASHSEHWLRVTKYQPIPDRILSELREDDLAIYENRLVSTIIDGSLRWLTETVQRLREQVEAERHRTEVQAISYYLRWRRLARWLGAEAEAGELGRLEDRRREVQDLVDHLRALERTPLREGTRGAPRVDELHITNLLANDGRYRRMVDLWSTMRAQSVRHATGRQELDAVWRERFADADSYTELLMVRACADIGLVDPVTGEPSAPDLSVLIHPSPPGVRAVLEHRNGSRLTVHAAMVGAGLSTDVLQDGAIRPYLDKLASNATASGHINCLLHPMTTAGTDGAPALIDLGVRPAALGLTPWHDGAGLVILPVHPLGIDCLERLGRVLRIAAGILRADTFPPATSLVGDHALLPPASLDMSGTGLEIQDGQLVALAETVAAPQLRAPTRPGPRHHHHQPTEHNDDPWTEELEALRLPIEGLLTCSSHPLEHRSSFTTVDHWTRNGYRARCTGCSAVWGVRTCAACNRRYPFTYVDYDQQWIEARELPGGPAEYFGMDLEAEPCSLDRTATICPRCLTCSNGGHDVCDAL